MPARAAAAHLGGPPPQARSVAARLAAAGNAVEAVGDGAQAVQARPALARALRREVVEDARGLEHPAGVLAEHPENARADGAAREQRIVLAERQLVDAAAIEPAAAVAADEQRLGSFGRAFGLPQQFGQPAAEGDLVDA